MAILIMMSDMSQHPGDTIGNPTKCYVDYLQMLSSLSAFSVAWSSLSGTMLDIASTGDLGPSFASMTCFTVPYESALVLNVLSPVIMFGLLVLGITIRRALALVIRSQEVNAPFKYEVLRGLGVVLFLSYVSVCKGSFRHFHCSVINGRSLLVADYNIECDSPEHRQSLPWALLGLSVVVIVPIAWAVFITLMASHPVRRSSMMIISEKNAGRRGSAYRTVGSMFANVNFPKNDDDVSLSSLISASWESVRMLYVATVLSPIVTITHNVSLFFQSQGCSDCAVGDLVTPRDAWRAAGSCLGVASAQCECFSLPLHNF
jgi:hypothetical protein